MIHQQYSLSLLWKTSCGRNMLMCLGQIWLYHWLGKTFLVWLWKNSGKCDIIFVLDNWLYIYIYIQIEDTSRLAAISTVYRFFRCSCWGTSDQRGVSSYCPHCGTSYFQFPWVVYTDALDNVYLSVRLGCHMSQVKQNGMLPVFLIVSRMLALVLMGTVPLRIRGLLSFL